MRIMLRYSSDARQTHWSLNPIRVVLPTVRCTCSVRHWELGEKRNRSARNVKCPKKNLKETNGAAAYLD